MQRLVAGGTGLVGQYLVNHWLSQHIKVTVLGRCKNKISHVFGTAVDILDWDDFANLSELDLKQFDTIVNLCGTNIGEARWTKKRKAELINSRVDTTKIIVNKLVLLADNAPRLLNASAIGIYGIQPSLPTHLPSALDEDTKINFEHPCDFLSEICVRWEQATEQAKAHGVNVVNMRFGVVLTPVGGALEKLATPFKFGLGGKIGSGQQAFTWIHIQDLINMIDFICQHPNIHGAINCVAPEAVMQKTLAKTIAKTLHRPCLLTLPSFVVEILFGEMGKYLLLNGQNIYPKRFISYDFKYAFPDLQSAIDNLLQTDEGNTDT